MTNQGTGDRKETVTQEDGGLEKAVRDYQRVGGANGGTDTAKELEGKIAKAHASHDEQLKKARPQQSGTAGR